jgi:histidinol-phosphate/aromatic aminotransferase/cobyric acid decarboxylase-like protein
MLAQKLAIALLERPAVLSEWVAEVVGARQWCFDQLAQISNAVYPSHGNFLLFEVRRPAEIVAELKANYIYIRDKTTSTGGGLRVSVTRQDAMERFVGALRSAIRETER